MPDFLFLGFTEFYNKINFLLLMISAYDIDQDIAKKIIYSKKLWIQYLKFRSNNFCR